MTERVSNARSRSANRNCRRCDTMKPCCARTKRRNGAPCRLKATGKGGRCRYHGGLLSGPRTPEGKARVAEAQRHRWDQYRALHPRLFPNEISARHERRIKKVFRERQKLHAETRQWLADRFGPEWPAKLEQMREERERRRVGEQRQRQATAEPASEQTTDADRCLGELVAQGQQTATQRWLRQQIESSKAIQARLPAPMSAQPTHSQIPVDEKPKARQVELHLDRQPIHRIRRLEREERKEAENAFGRALIERYGLLRGQDRPQSYLIGRNAFDRARARRRR
jgi:hypothetical protein